MQSSTVDLTGTQATGAHGNRGRSTVYQSLYLADIGLPGSIGLTVGVRNVVTKHDTLSANTTFCHF